MMVKRHHLFPCLLLICIMVFVIPARAEATGLSVTYPTGGERIPAGSTQMITWEGYEDYELDVYLSTNSGRTYDVYLGSGIGGAFSWTVPDIATYRARIRVTGEIPYLTRLPVTVEAESDADFSIGRVPEAPTDLSAVALSSSEIQLSWTDNADNEEGFSIERNQHEVFTVGQDVQNAIHASLPADTLYSYRVRAYNSFGYSGYSNTVRVATLPEDPSPSPPEAPSRLRAEALSDSEIHLMWRDNADNEEGFTVERDGEEVAQLGAGEDAFTDTGLDADTTYTYRVRAYNAAGPSDYSNVATGTTLPDTPPLSDDAVIIRLNIGRTEYYVDDERRIMDAAPMLEESRTLLPIRYVVEPLGAFVSWNRLTQKVTVTLDETVVELWVGQNQARVNGVYRFIDEDNPNVMPMIVPPGRTMLPIRFITESLGCQVAWDAPTEEVTVIYDPRQEPWWPGELPEVRPDCAEVIITFEDFADGTEIFNQYGTAGVTFPGVPSIVEPEGVELPSGTRALGTARPGEEFGGKLVIEFTTGQTCVNVFVGLLDDTHDNKILATLEAFDAGETVIIPGYGMEVYPSKQVAIQQGLIGPGPTETFQRMTVETEDEPQIYRVELSYQGGYFPVIDDLGFSVIGEPFAEVETRPSATIETPRDGEVISGFGPHSGAIDLMGTVHEEFKLRSVTYTLTHEDGAISGQLPFTGEAPTYTFGGINIHGLVLPGENSIRVIPRSWSTASTISHGDSVTVYVEPLLESGDEAELLILTADDFYHSLVPLRDWKNATGISTHIMTLSSIEGEARFAGSRDITEQVKRAIAHAYLHHGTRYVMLVGDGDRFPVRYFRTGREGVSWGVVYPITDLYYACLFKPDGTFDDWDGNGNGIIGEWWAPHTDGGLADSFAQMNIDDCSLKPDVALGRIPASTVEEVEAYVSKVIEYESSSSSAYDNMVLWNGPSDFRSDHEALDRVAAEILPGFTAQKHYRPEGFESWSSEDQEQYLSTWRQQLRTDLNQGATFAIYFGHGSRTSMGVLRASDVQSLANVGLYPVFVASACDTAKFVHEHDIYVDVDGNYPPCWPSCPPEEGDTWPGPNPEPAPIQPSHLDVDSMAEALLLVPEAGAIGLLGARSGTNTASHPFVKLFLEAYNSEQGERLGGMWVAGVTAFVEQYLETDHWFGRSNLMSRHIHIFALFGDPSLRIKRR